MSPRAGRRGFTLIELIVALTVSTIVLGAAFTLLKNNQRFYRSQSQITGVSQNIRAVAELLPAELRELSAAGGDIVAMFDTSITIRAARGLGIICDTTAAAASGQVTLRNSQWFGYRAVDATRDGIYVFNDVDPQMSSDDTWARADITSTTAANCLDGTAGTRLQLSGVAGGNASLASVTMGSPARTYESVAYRLWNDGSGTWWLGVSQLVSGSWTATSAVAGPLRPNNGLTFQYLDAAVAVTAVPANVASIVVTVRGQSDQPIFVQGRPQGTFTDSLTVRAMLRGN